MAQSAINITRALKGRWNGNYGMVRCPAHKDKTPSCKLSDGASGLMVHCFAGCDWRDVKHEFERQGYLEPWKPDGKKYRSNSHAQSADTAHQAPNPQRSDKDVSDKRAYALQIWNEAQNPHGTLGQRYLQGRAITINLPSCIRFHPALKHPNSNKTWPALIFAYTSYTGEFDGIQRIYLDPRTAKKAPITPQKLSLGTFPGGMIRLGNLSVPDDTNPFYGELGLCEGPEDGLSIMQMYSVPVWVAGAGEKMAMADLPTPLDNLFIYRDRGIPGIRYAKKTLATHCMKVRKRDAVPCVNIIAPNEGFDDFNAMHQALELESEQVF